MSEFDNLDLFNNQLSFEDDPINIYNLERGKLFLN